MIKNSTGALRPSPRLFSSFLLGSLCAFAIFLCLAGCRKIPPEPPPDPFPEKLNRSDSLSVSIFIDATKSMEGFVTPGTHTEYCRIMDQLEDAINTGWMKVDLDFYRFGCWVESLTREQFLGCTKEDFYCQPRLHLETHIDSVLNVAATKRTGSSASLAIIVTDLFQDESDISCITNSLRDTYMRELQQAVAIIGLRSQFVGSVYDVSRINENFSYTSGTEDKGRYRPFYLLVIGKHADVDRFAQSMSAMLPEIVDLDYYLIFSRYLGDPLATLKQAQISDYANFDKCDPAFSDIPHFTINADKGNSWLKAKIPFAPLPNTLRYLPRSYRQETSISIFTSDKPEAWYAYKPPKNPVSVRILIQGAREIEVEVRLDPKALGTAEWADISTRIFPDLDKDMPLPPWCRDWDMPVDKLAYWQQHREHFDGSTTYNLYRFMYGLTGALIEVQPPMILDLRFTLEIK